MSLLNASQLSKSYGAVDIIKGISISIPQHARIAIVGPNGIGKTTLLRVLVGIEEPTAGTVQRARGIHIGYLPQEASLESKLTLWEECLIPFEHLRSIEKELRALEDEMAVRPQAEDALSRYGELQHQYEHHGGYIYETRIRQILTGLGFEPRDYPRLVSQLSGGQRTRALLAKLLLSNPDLLILDEPTNHLDIAAVEWLESYLALWPGATLIVSHDRYFLDKVVNTIWEMQPTGIEMYSGNYSAYLQQRQERWDFRQKIFESEMERLLKEVDYIKRNISGQNTNQAKGRLRRLSREVQAIESLGLENTQSKQWSEIVRQADISEHVLSVDEAERRVRSLRGPQQRPPRLHLFIKAQNRSGDLVLRTHNLVVGYCDEGRPLFQAPDLLLKRGECAAIIGPNGAGKTTFLKTLLGIVPPLSGEVLLGASLNIGYFAQAHEDLNPERTLMEEILTVEPNMLQADIRSYIAKYLFTGEDVFRRVSTLSGGEKGRLALAKLSLTNANLLLLDEPTNHLDIPSQEILQQVLAEYQGTIFLVSHDRYLIDALGTQIWEILPDEGSMRVFDGSYSAYRESIAAAEAEKAAINEKELSKLNQKTRLPSISPEERQRRNRLKEVETLISDLEIQLNLLSQKLEKPPPDASRVQKMGKEYVRLQAELDDLMQEWEDLQA